MYVFKKWRLPGVAAGLLLALQLVVTTGAARNTAQPELPTQTIEHQDTDARVAPQALARQGYLSYVNKPGSARTPTPTPRPPSNPTPTPSPPSQPVPTQPPGAMEPIAPDWIANCAGNTVPFEEQAWWINDFGHVHAGFCAPQNQTLRGSYTFNVRLVMHNNPGTLSLLQAQIDSTGYGLQNIKVNMTCPINTTCTRDQTVTLDTSEFPYDGWHQIRIRASVNEPDGKQMVASSFIPVYLSNGKPRQDLTPVQLLMNGSTDYLSGRGWYTGAGYVFSSIMDPRTASQRVSGVYQLQIRTDIQENSRPLTKLIVKLDATHTAAGETLIDMANPEDGETYPLSIDTTRLSNGWHSLLARVESANQPGATCSVCSGQPQTHAGVSKVWFFVQN